MKLVIGIVLSLIIYASAAPTEEDGNVTHQTQASSVMNYIYHTRHFYKPTSYVFFFFLAGRESRQNEWRGIQFVDYASDGTNVKFKTYRIGTCRSICVFLDQTITKFSSQVSYYNFNWKWVRPKTRLFIHICLFPESTLSISDLCSGWTCWFSAVGTTIFYESPHSNSQMFTELP